MYKKYTSNSYIYTKNVHTVQNLYIQSSYNKKDLKLEVYVLLYIQIMYKLYKIQLGNWNGLCICILGT